MVADIPDKRGDTPADSGEEREPSMVGEFITKLASMPPDPEVSGEVVCGERRELGVVALYV